MTEEHKASCKDCVEGYKLKGNDCVQRSPDKVDADSRILDGHGCSELWYYKDPDNGDICTLYSCQTAWGTL